MTPACSPLRRLRFMVAGLPYAPVLDLARDEGQDLLDWIGLGRPEFGAIDARDLAPRCRRRLWDVERNDHPLLRGRTSELLSMAERAGERIILFG
ncbi:MAG: hypothetical protein JST00_25175 [Deltaproteobacteria bacterium]|nr:hypothetical protein [Deltaproteobacteria bacterium]